MSSSPWSKDPRYIVCAATIAVIVSRTFYLYPAAVLQSNSEKRLAAATATVCGNPDLKSGLVSAFAEIGYRDNFCDVARNISKRGTHEHAKWIIDNDIIRLVSTALLSTNMTSETHNRLTTVLTAVRSGSDTTTPVSDTAVLTCQIWGQAAVHALRSMSSELFVAQVKKAHQEIELYNFIKTSCETDAVVQVFKYLEGMEMPPGGFNTVCMQQPIPRGQTAVFASLVLDDLCAFILTVLYNLSIVYSAGVSWVLWKRAGGRRTIHDGIPTTTTTTTAFDTLRVAGAGAGVNNSL
jgi:hypothetical protein